MADEWQGQLSYTDTLEAGSPTPLSPGPSPLGCLGKTQGLLSRVQHTMRGRASYGQPLDIHVVLGSCSNQGHQHLPLPLHSPGLVYGPQQQLRPGPHHSPRWWGWTHTRGYSSLPGVSSLISLHKCSICSISLSLPSDHHTLAHCDGF